MSAYRELIALRELSALTGKSFSVEDKSKQLNKFGSVTVNAADTWVSIQPLSGSETEETFCTTNILDRVVSTDAGDTGNVTIEGHTIDAQGNMTFAVQTVALTGQTPAALTTSLARVTRLYRTPSGSFATPATPLVGTIRVFASTEGGTVTAGVPAVHSATRLLVPAGVQQSVKAATTISFQDAWLITAVEFGLDRATGSTVAADFLVETRDVANGGVWRPLSGSQIPLRVGSVQVYQEEFVPWLLVPPNHDVRARVNASASGAEVYCNMTGILAIDQAFVPN